MANEELLKELLGEGKKKEFDIGMLLRTLWRKKHLIIIPLVLSWMIAVFGLHYIPPTFVAVSSVAIENNTSFTRDLEQLLDDQSGQRRDVSQLAKVRAEIRNQDFLDGVIEALDLGRTPVIREMATKLTEGQLSGSSLEDVVNRLAAEEIRKRTEVRIGSSGVYNIRSESHDPENAYILNQVITRKYIESRRQGELAEITAKGDFSDEQVAIYKEKLHRAEQELERFRQIQQQAEAEGNPVDGDNVILAEEVMRRYREELNDIEAQVSSLRTQLRNSFGVVPTSERFLIDQSLRSLENKQIHTMLQNLVQYLSVASRGAESLTESIEDASVGRDRQSYRDRAISLVNQVYASQSPRQREQIVGYYYRLMLVSSFQELVDTLNRYVNNFRDNLSGAPAIQAELERREAEVTKFREFLDAFQQQSTSAQITRAIQTSQLAARIEIRDAAVMPIRPIKPNKPRLQIIFMGMGIMAGLLIVFMTEFFNRSYSRVEDIESDLGAPVLGTIPAMPKGIGQAKIQKRKNTLLWVIAMILFIVAMSGMMFFIKNLYSRAELQIDKQAAQEMGYER